MQYREELIRKKIQSDMHEASAISLTTDGWTSLRHDSHLSVTASYIDKDWQLQTPTLSTLNLTERHTKLYLGNQILNVSKYVFKSIQL